MHDGILLISYVWSDRQIRKLKFLEKFSLSGNSLCQVIVNRQLYLQRHDIVYVIKGGP